MCFKLQVEHGMAGNGSARFGLELTPITNAARIALSISDPVSASLSMQGVGGEKCHSRSKYIHCNWLYTGYGLSHEQRQGKFRPQSFI